MAGPNFEDLYPDRTDPPSTDPLGQPGARDYTLVCVAALLVQVVVLLQEDLSLLWCVVPLLIGCASLVARWSIGPPLVLLVVTGLFLVRYRYRYGWGADLEMDLLTDGALAGSTLVYVAGAYRLLSLTRHIFPPETRRWKSRLPALEAPRWLAGGAPRHRPAEQVRTAELWSLFLAAVLFVLLAAVAWVYLADTLRYPPRLSQTVFLSRTVWQAVVVVWLAALTLAVSAAVLGYVGYRQMSREEALLYLQDQQWQQLRAEQARVQGWRVWGKLRGERRRKGR